jgi:hypothetical protein
MDCRPGDRRHSKAVARLLAPLRCRARPPPREFEAGNGSLARTRSEIFNAQAAERD